MKTWKRLLIGLLVLVSLFSLTACLGETEEDYSLHAGTYECTQFFIISAEGKRKNYGSDGEYLRLDDDGRGVMFFWDLEKEPERISWSVKEDILTIYYDDNPSEDNDTMSIKDGVIRFEYTNDDGTGVEAVFELKQ